MCIRDSNLVASTHTIGPNGTIKKEGEQPQQFSAVHSLSGRTGVTVPAAETRPGQTLSDIRPEHNPKFSQEAQRYPHYTRPWDGLHESAVAAALQEDPMLFQREAALAAAAARVKARKEGKPEPKDDRPPILQYDSLAYGRTTAAAPPYWQTYQAHIYGSPLHHPRHPAHDKKDPNYKSSLDRPSKESFGLGRLPEFQLRNYGTWWHSAV
eukprot:TRINITY_DN14517_c0_g1_i3.p1 TRINITY_DN14517_c0_g1~~TRINITY_DN14517_c0_g1_i3.p1  ORF type:complete len:210 (-),score=22.60 TRINITY_DN14517_c0_g1_i3:174-803(-)